MRKEGNYYRKTFLFPTHGLEPVWINSKIKYVHLVVVMKLSYESYMQWRTCFWAVTPVRISSPCLSWSNTSVEKCNLEVVYLHDMYYNTHARHSISIYCVQHCLWNRLKQIFWPLRKDIRMNSRTHIRTQTHTNPKQKTHIQGCCCFVQTASASQNDISYIYIFIIVHSFTALLWLRLQSKKLQSSLLY